MNNMQGLYYAFGQLAYAVAASDGSVQEEEKLVLHDLLKQTVEEHNLDFNYSEIVFNLLEKDHIHVELAYEWAMREFKLNEYYLTEEKKRDFIYILERIAEAKPPVTSEEKSIIDCFKEEIAELKADPVFTNAV